MSVKKKIRECDKLFFMPSSGDSKRQQNHKRWVNLTSEKLERERIRKRDLERKRRANDPHHNERKAERARQRRMTPEQKKRDREDRLKYKYGMTSVQWNRMFDAQGRCCAICKSPEPGSRWGWATDHCHSGKRVRGILCYPCNAGLGLFRDNIVTLQAAMDYLIDHAVEVASKLSHPQSSL